MKKMTIDEAIKDIKENIQPSVGGTSLKMAIVALERMKPKKPNRVKNKFYEMFVCPKCNHRLGNTVMAYQSKCCDVCGQVIDWETVKTEC